MLLNAYGEAVLARARRMRDEIEQATRACLPTGLKASTHSPGTINSLLFNGRKLQLLIDLTNSRNISSTAAHLGMTPAGASMALSRIEAAFGQPLFQRKMQGMVATEAVDRLVVHAKRVFAELRHMTSDIAAISGYLTGTVVVGTDALGRSHFFSTALAMVVSKHPGLRITMVETPYDRLIGSLRNGDVDIVFGGLRNATQNHGLTTEALFSDRLGVVVRAGHPLARRKKLQISELLNERWILPSLGRRPLVDASFRKLGLDPPAPAIETGDAALLRQLLSDSNMLAVASPNQLMFEIRSGSLTELPLTFLDTGSQVGLVVRDGAMLSPAAHAILEAVRSEVRD
jgi:LysR family transcriptional regulator of gallate degradation